MPTRPSDPSAETTHFGFREVPRRAKAGLVREVFDSVAGRYDVMNDLMSLGLHRLWKRALVDWLRPRPGMQLADLAGGTGDIAFRFLELAGGGAAATVVDINASMLAVGRARAGRHGHAGAVSWTVGDAERLPLADASVDAVTIAFGIRNCTEPAAVLREAHRVLRFGGRFLCLEFSRLALPGLSPLYDAWSFQAIPRIGQLVTRDRDAYVYLVESIRRFPEQERFAAMLAEAGLAQVAWRNLSGGVAAMHSGWKI